MHKGSSQHSPSQFPVFCGNKIPFSVLSCIKCFVLEKRQDYGDKIRAFVYFQLQQIENQIYLRGLPR